ncbi:MAG: hypothetical protein PHN88_10305 [Ignavibacteria bacterium]|nr:hypothetical protein [Ignavibacteria bacterium]
MKKISIITGILIIALTVFTGFTINQQTEITADQFKVHVVGCDDCSKLHYCINGGASIYPGSCDFIADCDVSGTVYQTICVICDGKFGSAAIICGQTKDITITLTESGTVCSCKK